MLSYQHAFHAGNHADVLKHLVLVAILHKLNAKPKPYFVLDTHAGSGVYPFSQTPDKADETAYDLLFEGANLHEPLHSKVAAADHYFDAVKHFLLHGEYPGSPLITSHIARTFDVLHANELSNPVHEELKNAIVEKGNVYTQLHQRDGFEALLALVPPKVNRGLVLIDPPYENISEYEGLAQSVVKAVKKWPNGIYAIWYPLLSTTRINRKTQEVERNPKANETPKMLNYLSHELTPLCTKGILSVEFALQAPSPKMGMYGSGVCIINPPYQLDTEMADVIELMSAKLKQDTNHLSGISWLLAPH